jgi:hypothetical protein
MAIKIKYRRSVLVLFTIIVAVFILVRCMGHEKKQKPAEESTRQEPARFEEYASSQNCAGCHKEIYDSHIHTAHYMTAQPANEEYIKGSFKKGKNTYSYGPSILLSMEKRDSGLYQVVYYKEEEKRAMRFDMVIGSGVMGQSFLTWRMNKLYQLPITYFTAADQWSNSPGFPKDKVLIDRPVTSRCLECHASFAQGTSGTALEPIEFDRNKIIYGIDCQKCHGPAAKHVDYQTQHPQEKTAKYIINPSKLSRLQQLDVCALCHSGNIQKTKPSFEFTAGKNLSDYFIIDTLNDVFQNSADIDVHGNQYALLKASKCFKLSATMTCNTCHNTHENERGKKELFSQRCMGCHNPAADNFKTATHASITAIDMNCIDCHMPSQPSKSIAVFLQGEETPRASQLRSHFIGIYPEEIKKFINKKSK